MRQHGLSAFRTNSSGSQKQKLSPRRNASAGMTSGYLESVRKVHAGLPSLLSISRMDAKRRKASPDWLRFSQSFASRRQRFSQANVRSTIQRLGSTTKALA